MIFWHKEELISSLGLIFQPIFSFYQPISFALFLHLAREMEKKKDIQRFFLILYLSFLSASSEFFDQQETKGQNISFESGGRKKETSKIFLLTFDLSEKEKMYSFCLSFLKDIHTGLNHQRRVGQPDSAKKLDGEQVQMVKLLLLMRQLLHMRLLMREQGPPLIL